MMKHINKYFAPHTPVELSNVAMANGVTAVISMLSFILGNPDDGILLMRPVYGKFENDLTITTQYRTDPTESCIRS
jgi:1-aminocyclopropane-1-carboxylate synthase